MRIVFRADASRANGSGHVMRSSALAEEVIARNIEAVFVGNIQELPWVNNRIAELGFSKILSKEDDFAPNPKTDILILDSYTVSVDSPFIQPKNWLHVISISDSLTPSYKSSLTIFPGLDSNLHCESNRKNLTGPAYLLLRKSIKKKSNSFSERKKMNIVVTGGGSDPFDFSGKMSEILAAFDFDFNAIFLISQNSKYTFDSRFRFLEIGALFDEIIEKADIVFTTASTSCFEMIAREIPTGVVCVVDNQLETYLSLKKREIVQPIGIKDIEWNLDIESIEDLIKSEELRSKLIKKTAGLIDLMGSTRILDAILDLPDKQS